MARTLGPRLPAELLISIADHLCSNRDIVALGLTCKSLYTLLLKTQKRSLEIYFTASEIASELPGTSTYGLLNSRTALLTVAGINTSFEHVQHGFESCRLQDCRCYRFTEKMIAANRLFSQNDCKLAKSIKELTLSGYFPYQKAKGCSLTSNLFIRSGGFKAMRPEIFQVNLEWNDWKFSVLQGMSVTNLKILKLPIHEPSDCVGLGQALAVMPKLVSLTITDIPDRDEFVSRLEHIGEGIISCASTLRELDIEMTNFNRSASWAEDEHFIEPEDDGFFFGKLFPCSSEEELLALCERNFRNQTDPMAEASLNLTKLRLKHVSLPWYSFGIIFNAITIRHLHLPYAMVDEQVWGLLEMYAQLDTLTEVSYDMLSTRFLNFLKEQSSLKELTFARPQDRYDGAGFTFYGNSAYLMIRVSRQAPRIGVDTGVDYPGLDEFLSSLENITMLEHLVLPTDMYTITGGFLSSIAASLTSLEHLELGFDYNDLVRATIQDMKHLSLTVSSVEELQLMFASCFLCSARTLRKITFFSLKQPEPLPDLDAAQFHVHIASFGSRISSNIKLVRYMPLNQVHQHPYGNIDLYYHREMAVDGLWWMLLPLEEDKKLFAEGRTPRIVPVDKWDWETEGERTAYQAGLEELSFGKLRAK